MDFPSEAPSQPERQPGFYWVREDDGNEQWEPAKWDGKNWWLIGWEVEATDRDILEIGPAIPPYQPGA